MGLLFYLSREVGVGANRVWRFATMLQGYIMSLRHAMTLQQALLLQKRTLLLFKACINLSKYSSLPNSAQDALLQYLIAQHAPLRKLRYDHVSTSSWTPRQ